MSIRYPIRLNHYLAEQKVASRREADRLIAAGLVTINGRPAHLGEKVNRTDKVVVASTAPGKKTKELVYFAFNKPIGVVSQPEAGQKSIKDVVKNVGQIFPLGRLDKDSHGLILLTNDGRLTEGLLDPKFNHEKEYRITVDKNLTPMFQKGITSGVKIEGYTTKTARLKKISPTEFFLTLTEGKKHQIRRMCAALGYQVKDLERVRIMNIELGTLAPGVYRPLTEEEKTTLLQTLGLERKMIN